MIKNKTLEISLFIFTLLFFIEGFSQNFECASGFMHEKLMETDAVYFKNNQLLESEILKATQNNSKKTNTVYTIPVVIHVIHLGEPIGTGTNISDDQILQAIDGLNNRFGNGNGYGIDIGIRFCLASIDPNGINTTGINRINAANLANYSSSGVSVGTTCNGPSEYIIKDLSRWPVTDYYNIWVVNNIHCQSYSGLAYYPSNSQYDGTLITSQRMHGGSTVLTHELGHAFNLYHTFNGSSLHDCPIEINCTTDGDRVCDTQPHATSNCGSTNLCSGNGIWENTVTNYMSYCSNSSRILFTVGQKNRMIASAIASPRASLLTSAKCNTLGVNDVIKDILIIYPNPAADFFTIQLINSISNGKIKIYNIIGEVIYEENISNSTTGIRIDKLSKGLYLVEFSDGFTQTIKKLIIN